jgi:hypothetical protein
MFKAFVSRAKITIPFKPYNPSTSNRRIFPIFTHGTEGQGSDCHTIKRRQRTKPFVAAFLAFIAVNLPQGIF